jgi:hypothetical protein
MPLARSLAAVLFGSISLAGTAHAQPPAPPPSRCALEAGAAAWIKGASDSWTETSRGDLGRDGSSRDGNALPWIIFFDSSCIWQLNARGTASPLTGGPHQGRITLPDESTIDATVTSFAATYSADDRPFLVMALPAVWRKEPRHAANPDLERLMRSVFVHEMTHTAQGHSTGARLKELEQRSPLPADLTDDIIQQRFGDVPGFREAYETERDLLFRAAAEPDAVRRRALATEALDAMTGRRARYFSGPNAIFADLEDLFLNLEGVANWAAYRTALRELASPAEAVTFIRRARSWSQDEGLALFLVIDSLLPGWQPRVFEDKPASVVDLLRLATHPNG